MLNETVLSRIDLNLLVLFEVVIDECHVGRAAVLLNLSPSAVSHGVSRLRRLFDDPLFVRTPRGVTPTAKAVELREPVVEALTRLRSILTPQAAFDPITSERRFVIGAPDGVSAVLLPPLLRRLRADGSSVRISSRELMPDPGEQLPAKAWTSSFNALDLRSIDVAVLPIEPPSTRFHAEALYDEDFVVVTRADHPLARGLTLDQYCLAEHLLVTQSGEPMGFVDRLLIAQGRSRIVTTTVSNFMLALAVLSASDLISALPRQLVKLHGARFGVVGSEPPISLGSFSMRAIIPKGLMADQGIAWLVGELEQGTRQ